MKIRVAAFATIALTLCALALLELVRISDKLTSLDSALMVVVFLALALVAGAAIVGFASASARSDALAAEHGEAQKKVTRDLKSATGAGAENRQTNSSHQSALDELKLEVADMKRREKLLIEKAVDVICVIDPKARIVSVNRACETAWGYNREELQGKDFASVLESNAAEQFIKSTTQAQASISRISFESQVRRKDGRLVDVIFTGHWSASEEGLFCIIHDISQQKLVEAAVRESQQRLQLMLESLPTAVVVATERGDIEFANHAAYEMLRYGSGELMGKAVSTIITAPLASQASAVASERIETKARTASGDAVPIELWRNAIEMSGAPKALLVFLDKSAEHELARIKRDFMAMITHDLRSPLTAVQGILSLLEQGILGQLPAKAQEMAEKAQKECSRIVRLLNDMLQVEKLESGTFELRCTDIALQDIVASSVESQRLAAATKNVTLVTDLQSADCYADDQRLQQVLVNLLSNAIKYSPAGSCVQISLRNDNGCAIVTVSDQGRGIPTDKLDKIFDKYEQVDASDNQERGGFGLGLAICKAIMEQHHGKIGVESSVGQGSKFWFSLPTQGRQAHQ